MGRTDTIISIFSISFEKCANFSEDKMPFGLDIKEAKHTYHAVFLYAVNSQPTQCWDIYSFDFLFRSRFVHTFHLLNIEPLWRYFSFAATIWRSLVRVFRLPPASVVKSKIINEYYRYEHTHSLTLTRQIKYDKTKIYSNITHVVVHSFDSSAQIFTLIFRLACTLFVPRVPVCFSVCYGTRKQTKQRKMPHQK